MKWSKLRQTYKREAWKAFYLQKVNLFAWKTRPPLKPGAYVTNWEELFTRNWVEQTQTYKNSALQKKGNHGSGKRKLVPRIGCSSWPAGTWRLKKAALGKLWGPFLEGPENFSGPESHSKILNLTITELFYSHIFDMNRGSLHTRSFRRIHFSVFR